MINNASFDEIGQTRGGSAAAIQFSFRNRANFQSRPLCYQCIFDPVPLSTLSLFSCAFASLSKLETVDIVRLRISAQKLVPTSSRVARIYVSDSDRRVSYAPHDWSNSCVCVTVHHSSLDMSKFTEGSWQRAFTAVKEQFELESLLPEQENALRGYGKSLIFQCLPIAADALLDKPQGSSHVVVISPLRSLMEDQEVLFLNNNGVPAIAITDEEDPDIVQQVINGNYIVVEENSHDQVPQYLPFLLPMHPHRPPMTLLLSLLSRRYFLTRTLLVLFR